MPEMNPKEIDSLIRTMEELSKNAHLLERFGNKIVPADDIDKALEIVHKVRNRELVSFPCKVGDSIWVLTSDSPTGIEKTSVSSISLTKNSYKVVCKCAYDDWGNARWEFNPKDFGVKAFVSERAAKWALSHD